MQMRHVAGRWVGHLPLPFSTERFVRRLAPPEACRDDFEVQFEGYRFRGNLGSYIDWCIYFFGAYSRPELALLDRLSRDIVSKLGRRPVFADIGANVGNHTLFMSRRAERVVSFEPSPSVRKRMEAHISVNSIGNVTVIPAALGDRNGTATFHYLQHHANEGMGTTIAQTGWSSINVAMRRGDDVPELADVDIIKIDVEGAEPAVLAGLAATIQRRRPYILMELSNTGRASFATEAGLRRLLYQGALIRSVRRGRLAPFALAPFDFGSADEILISPV